jgi:D-serine deaminase-like pyridoxal phosphate-dependent protein
MRPHAEPSATRTDRPTAGTDFDALTAATAHLEPPFAALDLEAMQDNAADLVRRAHGTPIRVASKSVRCRAVLDEVLGLPGYRGVLALTLPEALWLARDREDVVVAYPSVDRAALRQLGADQRLAQRVTIMIDDVAQLDLVEASLDRRAHPVRVCLDLDASLELLSGRVHLGPRRSPVHSPDQAVELARAVLSRPAFRLVGLMSYEGQIAGVGDNAPGSVARRLAIRVVQRLSAAELRERRAAAVSAVSAIAPLEFVNGGGTGSIESTVAEPAVTEVAAGSGLYGPTLFDTYRRFRPRPAAFFVLPVVRRPAREVATVLGGGWVASGPAGRDRLPAPVWPGRVRLTASEGAGEAQTPLVGPGAPGLRIGDRVWFRHAKAGELGERVNELYLVMQGEVIASVPTYRGEGQAFL